MSFCIMATNCVVYDSDQRIPGYTPVGVLCEGCTNGVRAELNLLRYDYVDLSQLVVPVDVRNETGKIFRPKPESREPINLHPFTLRGDIAWFARQLVLVVREATGRVLRTAPMPVREGFQLDADVRFLIERVADIAALPATVAHWSSNDDYASELDGAGVVLRLRSMHRSARLLCGTARRVITVPGWCLTCNEVSLRRHDDDAETVWCQHCKARWTREEYQRMARLQYPSSADTA